MSSHLQYIFGKPLYNLGVFSLLHFLKQRDVGGGGGGTYGSLGGGGGAGRRRGGDGTPKALARQGSDLGFGVFSTLSIRIGDEPRERRGTTHYGSVV
jgi:hypothetical protein